MLVTVRPGQERRAHNGELVAPLRDGVPFRLEAATDRGWLYADTPGELLAALIDGYDPAATRAARVRARVAHALVLATQLQGELLAAAERAGDVLAEAARQVLEQAPYPVTAPAWDADVALVLLDVHYRPFTDLPPPQADRAPIRWLRPSGEWDYLMSMAEAGRLRLSEHA